MKTYKRINTPLLKNGEELFKIGDTSTEIIGDSANWEEVVENKTIWDLEVGDKYYYEANGIGEIWDTKWVNDYADKERLVIGNVFLTHEEAEEEVWKRKFETEMKRVFKPHECDWENSEIKYSICYDTFEGTCTTSSNRDLKMQGMIYCKDYETVEHFIKEHKKELKRYFGVKS